MRAIVLDTIGKMHAYHHDLFGWCRRCAGLYRMSDPPERARRRRPFDRAFKKIIPKPTKADRQK